MDVIRENRRRKVRSVSEASDWWQFRTRLEHRLLGTIAMLSVIVVCLAAYVIMQHMKNRIQICLTAECVQTASKYLNSLEMTADPCYDFQTYVCHHLGGGNASSHGGGELARAELSAMRRFEHVFDAPHRENDSVSLRHLKNLYGICMNRTTIDGGVLQLQRTLLPIFGGWPITMKNWDDEAFDWRDALMTLRTNGFAYESFFAFGVHENHTERRSYLKVSPPMLDSQVASGGHEYRKANQKLLRATLKAMGHSVSYDKNSLDEFTDDLIRIIAKHQTNLSAMAPHERREYFVQMESSATLVTLNEAQKLAPQIEWLPFLTNLTGHQFKDSDYIVFNMTDYMKDLHVLLETTPRSVQANFLVWEAIKNLQVWFNLQPQPRPTIAERRHLCIGEINKIMPLIANQALADEYAAKHRRKSVTDLVDSLHEQIAETIERSEWITSSMRKFVAEKLQNVQYFIGGRLENYTEFRIDYADNISAELRSDNFIQQIRKFKIASENFHYNVLFNRSTLELTMMRLLSMDATANAYYTPNNFIGISTGALYEMYDDTLPSYVNYARAGHLIGHEMSHVLSSFAHAHGAKGEATSGWSHESIAVYRQQHQCLVDAYENYTLEKYGVFLNGSLALDENLADVLGTHAAYEAFKLTKNGRHDEHVRLPALTRYSSEQMFWIAFAQVYCDPHEVAHVFEPAGAHHDDHGVASFRIYSTLSQSRRFAEDFECRIGTRMNPHEKCYHS